MKKRHKYNDDLETFLMFLSEDELMEWFETNTIEYERTLLEVILQDKFDTENQVC